MRSHFGGEPTAHGPLAIDHLATSLGLHPGTETEHPGTLDLADTAGVVHRHGETPEG